MLLRWKRRELPGGKYCMDSSSINDANDVCSWCKIGIQFPTSNGFFILSLHSTKA